MKISIACAPGPQVRALAERPERERHLAVHFGHVTHLSKADRMALATFAGNVPWNGWVDGVEAIRARARQAQAAGTTELLFVPSGDDLVREADAFFRAVESLVG